MTVEWMIASGLSPEETLRQLNSLKIDWYITEHGDLMIRYWQVGAEDFVSPEHVGRLQSGREAPSEIDSLEWVSRNLGDLRARYGGQWVAVDQAQVVAAAPTLPELMHACRDAGVERPFITQIPAEPVLWTTTYAG